MNSIVDDAFSAHERTAVAAKRNYHSRGRWGIAFVLAGMLLTLSLAFAPSQFSGRAALGVCAIVFAVAGIATQIHLLLSRTKQTWLLNRFAAERLRSIKFQAYGLASASASTADLKQQADAFYTVEVARLKAELNAAGGALMRFSPRAAIRKTPVRSAVPPLDAALAATARDAYRDLRIDYQRRFAADEIESLKRSQRVGSTAADLLYLAGLGMTLAGMTATVLTFSYLASAIDFLALAFFILGLLKAIMDNASLGDTTQGRYENYIIALDECDEELLRENASLPEIVQRFERTALGELAAFCEAALRISYRL